VCHPSHAVAFIREGNPSPRALSALIRESLGTKWESLWNMVYTWWGKKEKERERVEERKREREENEKRKKREELHIAFFLLVCFIRFTLLQNKTTKESFRSLAQFIDTNYTASDRGTLLKLIKVRHPTLSTSFFPFPSLIFLSFTTGP
jgi:hypothetical protein